LGLWGLFWVFFRVLGWVCGVLFVSLLGVLACTFLFSLFPFSIKLFITYQKKKRLSVKKLTENYTIVLIYYEGENLGI
jgi:hypothetical protein